MKLSFSGVPCGVVNMVFGRGQGAGEALVKHPDVPLISFTGGTVTAEKLRLAAAPFCKKMSLEVRFEYCLSGREIWLIILFGDIFLADGHGCLVGNFVGAIAQNPVIRKFLTSYKNSPNNYMHLSQNIMCICYCIKLVMNFLKFLKVVRIRTFSNITGACVSILRSHET